MVSILWSPDSLYSMIIWWSLFYDHLIVSILWSSDGLYSMIIWWSLFYDHLMVSILWSSDGLCVMIIWWSVSRLFLWQLQNIHLLRASALLGKLLHGTRTDNRLINISTRQDYTSIRPDVWNLTMTQLNYVCHPYLRITALFMSILASGSDGPTSRWAVAAMVRRLDSTLQRW